MGVGVGMGVGVVDFFFFFFSHTPARLSGLALAAGKLVLRGRGPVRCGR